MLRLIRQRSLINIQFVFEHELLYFVFTILPLSPIDRLTLKNGYRNLSKRVCMDIICIIGTSPNICGVSGHHKSHPTTTYADSTRCLSVPQVRRLNSRRCSTRAQAPPGQMRCW